MKDPTTNTASRKVVPSNDHLRLHLGEMTAQEMRTAKAAYQLALNTLTQQQGGEQEAHIETLRAMRESGGCVDDDAWVAAVDAAIAALQAGTP